MLTDSNFVTNYLQVVIYLVLVVDYLLELCVMKCKFLLTGSNGVLSKSKSRRCVTYFCKSAKLFLSVCVRDYKLTIYSKSKNSEQSTHYITDRNNLAD